MKFEICAATDVGCLRQNNEDGFYLNDMCCCSVDECYIYKIFETPVLAFVTDGVGGTEAGEEATRLCLDIAYTETIPYDENDIVALIEKMNNKVCDVRKQIDTACTLAGVLLGDDSLYWFNIGDSRIYSMSQGFMNQLSTDDTLSGLSGEEAERKEPLLQYIGKERLLPHIKETTEVTTYLVCTDGLTDMVSLDEIEDTFKDDDIRQIARKLVDSAKQKGGRDNITLIIIKPVKEDEGNG